MRNLPKGDMKKAIFYIRNVVKYQILFIMFRMASITRNDIN